MTVLSTLRVSYIETSGVLSALPASLKHFTSRTAINDTAASPAVSTFPMPPSAILPDVSDSHVVPPTYTTTVVDVGCHDDTSHGKAPIDGETCWYCSECGDGPYGEWQPCCQSCSHSKCSTCPVENK